MNKKLFSLITSAACAVSFLSNTAFAAGLADRNGIIPISAQAADEDVTLMYSGYCGSDVTYEIYSDKSLIIKGTGSMYYLDDSENLCSWDGPGYSENYGFDFERGQYYRYYDWDEENRDYLDYYNIFHNYRIEKVVIEPGVTNISQHTFKNCDELKSIEIPDTVTNIGSEAFNGCHLLENLIIPDSVTNIESRAFDDCFKLEYVNIPGSVEVIESFAFRNCGLSNVTLNEGLDKIGSYAFSGTELTSVDIPSSVSSIEYNSFDCDVNVSPSNRYYSSIDGVLFDKEQTTLIRYPESKIQISYTVPDSVTTIGSYAFYCYNSSLEEVILPDGLRRIEKDAFAYLKKLRSIELPETLEYIGDRAFYYCNSLKEAVVPENVTFIGEYAFRYCSSMTSVTILNPSCEIKSSDSIEKAVVIHGYSGSTAQQYAKTYGRTFVDIETNETLDFSKVLGENITYDIDPNGVCTISGTGEMYDYNTWTNRSPLCGESSINKVIVSEGITNIGEYAFYGCNAETIVLPEGLESIDEYAFYNCNAKNIVLPDDLTEISSYAFYNCQNLESIDLPDGLTTIGNDAFYNCQNLKSINFPDGLTTIRESAFCGCYELESVIIPDSVTTLGESAFAYCKNLKATPHNSPIKKRSHSKSHITA